MRDWCKTNTLREVLVVVQRLAILLQYVHEEAIAQIKELIVLCNASVLPPNASLKELLTIGVHEPHTLFDAGPKELPVVVNRLVPDKVFLESKNAWIWSPLRIHIVSIPAICRSLIDVERGRHDLQNIMSCDLNWTLIDATMFN